MGLWGGITHRRLWWALFELISWGVRAKEIGEIMYVSKVKGTGIFKAMLGAFKEFHDIQS